MKKELKRLLSICLATACISSGGHITSFATTTQALEMDNLDVLISAHYYLESEYEGESFWPGAVSNPEIMPLYDLNGKTIAYYLRLSDGVYGVVNNNLNNPAMIEFGEGDNPLIREIIDNNANPHIIYNNPFSLYDLNSEMATTRSRQQEPDLYTCYPELNAADTELAEFHAQQRAVVDNARVGAATYGDGDYGFVDWNNMPSGSYTADNLPMSGWSWVVTGDFNDIANNHCGATAVTNLALYFSSKGYSGLKKGSNRDTFIAVHNVVGDGPKMTIAGDAKTYFSNSGYSLNHSSIGTYDSYKKAIRAERPCGILLANGIVDWHWILGVGYRHYFTGDQQYMRIMDGWNRDVNRFYRPASGSLWVSATEYWM